MQFKKLLAISAISGVALGDSSNNSTLIAATPTAASGCSFSSYTATNAGQVQSVAACATGVGEVTIQGSELTSIDLTGVTRFFGDITVQNANLTTVINAPNLELISGTLQLTNLSILSTLNLAQLTTIGSLSFTALPALEKAGLTSGITTADSITVSDTGLTSLDGINVFQLKVFDVNNNKDIETIHSGLIAVTDTLSVSYNSEQVDIVFDQLTSANNVGFQSINSFSAQNLTVVNGSLSISSSSVDTVEFKSLQSIGKSLTINQNDQLDELDFPQLTSIGGAFQISDNDELKSLDGFPKLKTVSGSVNINGSFDNGTFSSLNRVDGGFNLQSTGQLSCSSFDQLNKNGDIKGDKYACSGAGSSSSSSSKKSSASGSSTETGSSSSGSSSSGSSTSTKSSSKSSGASSIEGKLAAIFAGFAAFGIALY